MSRVRRAVRDLVPRTPDETDYAAQLVASELTTNALLHGGGRASVVLTELPGGVRIEVSDGNRHDPMQALQSSESMTGRGMALIGLLAADWGVEHLDDGKVVWADVVAGATPRNGGRTPSSAWRDAGTEPLVDIEIGDVPTDLLVAAKRHVDNVLREFALAAGGHRSGTTKPIPVPLAHLVERVVEGFADARLAIKRLATEAALAGHERTSLRLSLPLSVADAALDYVDALDEVDTYSRANRLLTLETPPQHRVFRRWYVGEIVKQLNAIAAGVPPPAPVTLEQRLLQEVDAAEGARRSAERAARLYTVAVALSAAVTPEEVSSAVLTEGVAALGATGAGLLVGYDSERLTLTGSIGYDPDVLEKLHNEPRDADLPAAYALRSGEPVWLETVEERDTRFPGLVGVEPGTIAMCAVPVISDNAVLGALRFSFSERRLFDSDEQRFVLALAAETGEALQRAHLLRSEKEARERVVAHTRRLRRLADFAIAVNKESDIARLVEIVESCAREILGADSALTLIEAGAQRPADGDGVMTIPLLAPDGTHLAVVSVARQGRPFGEDDENVAVQLGEIAASALYRAMLHDERRRVAVALQQSLLPPTIPAIPGVDIATRYRPGSELVGGDFYDVFPLADTAWGVVIGDVRGKGPDAAAATALVRHSTRTAALLKGRPGSVLEVVNDALVDDADPERFCTAAYLRLVHTGGRLSVELASGGHPPLLLARRSGVPVEPIAPTGPLLGAFPTVTIADHALVLEPGDVLVAYTDGITEARAGGDEFGEARLVEVIDAHRADPVRDIASAVIDAMTAFAAETTDVDDAAVVVLRALAL